MESSCRAACGVREIRELEGRAVLPRPVAISREEVRGALLSAMRIAAFLRGPCKACVASRCFMIDRDCNGRTRRDTEAVRDSPIPRNFLLQRDFGP